MKILHISSERSWRGGEQQVAYLIGSLNGLGVANHVLCRQQSAFAAYCEQHRIPHYAAGFRFLSLFRTAIRLKKMSGAFDLIHAHTAKAHSLCFYALLLGMKADVVASRRVVFAPSSSIITKKKYLHAGVRKVICVSDAVKEVMQHYMGSGYAGKCATVYSGVDMNKVTASGNFDLRKKIGVDGSVKIIGNTSALTGNKDYFTFLDTAGLLLEGRKDLRFVVLGSGPLADELQAYAHRLQIAPYVHFMGFVDNPTDYLQHFDVFLMTSKAEGLGTSLIDALANGIPVVATDAGGIPELVLDRETGLLCRVENPKELKNAVTELLDDAVLRNEVVAGGLRHVRRFSKEVTAKKTLEIYEEVTGLFRQNS